MPFIAQNKTEIVSHTHRYKKRVKKYLYIKVKSNLQAYILENVTCNIFDKKNEATKKIEHQRHKNMFGKLVYHCYTIAIST